MHWARWRDRIESYRPLYVDALRIFLGLALFLRGLWYASDVRVVLDVMRGADIFVAGVVGHLVAGVQIIGGLFLALGLLTRVAVVALLPILIGAVAFIEAEGPFAGGGFELALFTLVSLIFFWFYGPGPLSLDARFREHWERKERAHADYHPEAVPA